MKQGAFILDGVESESLHTLMQTRPSIEAPLRKVEFRNSYGTDGDLPVDEGTYSNTSMELSLFTDGDDVIGDRQKLYNILDSRGVYKDFIPYFDPTKIYRVMLNNKVTFDHQYFFGEVQTASVTLTVKPYKYLVQNDTVIFTGTSKTIVNPTFYSSQPDIRIKGTGAVTITINGVAFNIKNVPGEITINSERYLAYQESSLGILTPMNNQIGTREYPILKPGSNTITVSGAVTEVLIKPKWRSLV